MGIYSQWLLFLFDSMLTCSYNLERIGTVAKGSYPTQYGNTTLDNNLDKCYLRRGYSALLAKITGIIETVDRLSISDLRRQLPSPYPY